MGSPDLCDPCSVDAYGNIVQCWGFAILHSLIKDYIRNGLTLDLEHPLLSHKAYASKVVTKTFFLTIVNNK